MCRLIDRVLEDLLLLLLLTVSLVGVYCAMDARRLTDQARNGKLACLRPAEGEKLTEEGCISDEQIGWITIDGSGIDDPIMQAADNTKYLNTNPEGEFSLSGSLFLDSRMSSDLTDAYSVIYGHHMENGLMFGALDAWRDAAFRETHKEGLVTTRNGCRRFCIFCVTEADARAGILFRPDPREAVLEALEQAAIAYSPPGSGPILALSTCTGSANTIRLLVVGTLEELDT